MFPHRTFGLDLWLDLLASTKEAHVRFFLLFNLTKDIWKGYNERTEQLKYQKQNCFAVPCNCFLELYKPRNEPIRFI
jgi:hypothetical protein